MTQGSKSLVLAALAASLAVAGCKSDNAGTASASSTTPVGDASAGADAGTTTDGGSNGGTSGSDVPALVSVNLQNVLNDLSVSLQVNRNNIPVTAQVPIDVAASVCGVSVDVLGASLASGHAECTATTTSASLNQAVQQQIASGGDVTGGDQTMGGSTGDTKTPQE